MESAWQLCRKALQLDGSAWLAPLKLLAIFEHRPISSSPRRALFSLYQLISSKTAYKFA